MEKRTKIILIVVLLVVIGLAIAIPLGIKVSGSSIKLEVWPHLDDNSDAPLIQYNTRNLNSSLAWSNRLNEFLKEYRYDSQQPLPQHTGGFQRVSCTFNGNVLEEKQVCDVPLEQYSRCVSIDGFQRTSPCLFFRLNKIRNWTPMPYNNTQEVLPQNMPDDLRNHINFTHDATMLNYVWLSCEGEDPADKELIGPVEYYPNRGFPSYYFPYTNKEGYLSPIVAVKFVRPHTGVLIKIVCTAWAKNIKNDKNGQQGTVHVSLLIDN